jgi:cholesterol oxidase
MAMDFDVIVIGSGFGGAITACRLAEAGYRVLVLERGRRWDPRSFPRRPGDPWTWSDEHPERENGWIDLRMFRHIAVAQGAGVGGGSLIYANISVEAWPETFQKGWPAEITYSELKPYYDAVKRFMNVQGVPNNQWTERMKLMRDAAEQAGFGARFRTLELAVTFDPSWTYENFEATSAGSKPITNAQGAKQGTCVHLGNCDIGCDVNARNTLDLNYIYWAETKYSAEVRPLHLVTSIQPITSGYSVHYDRLDAGGRVAGSATARIVVAAAGSLGSTELLLRCRDVTKTLPKLSPALGQRWSSNGDFLTPALYAARPVFPSRGPTIASAIDFHDGSQGPSFWIQDGGFPPLLEDLIIAESGDADLHVTGQIVLHWIRNFLGVHDPFKGIMPWFAQGIDAGNGRLVLKPGHNGTPALDLEWDIDESQRVIDAIITMHKRLSQVTGGLPLVPPTWSVLKYLVTPHPLGGCIMGTTPALGVVDHRGEVFGYPNLYVTDAAIIPTPLGVNPSRTIGALAERIAHIMIQERR